MSRSPRHACAFTYDFRPVGQGLFCRGELRFSDRGVEQRPFHWIYDCGSVNGRALRGEINLFRRQLPPPPRLDLLIVSHLDRDHVNGLGHLLNGLPVRHLVLPYRTPAERMLLAAESGGDDPGWMRFLVDPVTYLTDLPGSNIETIIMVLPNPEPLPPESVRSDLPDKPVVPPVEFHGLGSPEQDPLGADPGLFPRLRPDRVQVTPGRHPLSIYGLWEFFFYNRPQPAMEARLDGELQQIFQEFWQQPEAQRDYDDLMNDLRAAYRGVFGAHPAGRNDISLVTYTGPIPTRLHRGWYQCRNHCHYPATGQGRGAHGGQAEDAHDGKLSLLYTGDLTMDHPTTHALRLHFTPDRWRRMRFLQVPHHGADSSWQPGQAAIWEHQWSVFSAGLNHHYGHPHPGVLADLQGHGPVLVNEMQGAAWSGIVTWRSRRA